MKAFIEMFYFQTAGETCTFFGKDIPRVWQPYFPIIFISEMKGLNLGNLHIQSSQPIFV